jgi:hypothetical protein
MIAGLISPLAREQTAERVSAAAPGLAALAPKPWLDPEFWLEQRPKLGLELETGPGLAREREREPELVSEPEQEHGREPEPGLRLELPLNRAALNQP